MCGRASDKTRIDSAAGIPGRIQRRIGRAQIDGPSWCNKDHVIGLFVLEQAEHSFSESLAEVEIGCCVLMVKLGAGAGRDFRGAEEGAGVSRVVAIHVGEGFFPRR